MTPSGMTSTIRIVAKREGFRRAGIAHAGAPVDYLVEIFTPEQLEALRGEPMLVVQELDGPAAILSGAGAMTSRSPALAQPTPRPPAPPAGPADGSPSPEQEAEAQIARIVAAIPSIDQVDFTAAGRPRVAAVERVVGTAVTAEQIDAAWARHKAAEAEAAANPAEGSGAGGGSPTE